MRPQLDVTEVLLDPMFLDRTLVCIRRTSSVSDQGLLDLGAPTEIPFAGVVVQGSGNQMERLADGTRQKADLEVYTQHRLLSGDDSRVADLIRYNGREYTVTKVLDWSAYGRGFWHVAADLVSLS